MITGLITSGILKQIRSTAYVGKEFDRYVQDSYYKIIEGRITGKEIIDGIEFLHLVFENALNGKNRFLHILITSDYKTEVYPIIYESSKVQFKGKKCLLYFWNMLGFQKETYLDNLFHFGHEPGNSPEKFFEEAKLNTDDFTDNEVIIFQINFTNIYNIYDFAKIVWTKSNNEWKLIRDSYFKKFCKVIKEPKIKRKQRSNVTQLILYLFLIIFFPFDLITLPFQLFMLRGMVK